MNHYFKPAAICHYADEWEAIDEPVSISSFIREFQQELIQRIETLGLVIRPASLGDFEAIKQVQNRCFPEKIRTRVSFYEIYRILAFGNSAMLCTNTGVPIGFFLDVAYNNSEKVVFGVRIAVDADYGGHNLGALLSMYAALSAMERGGKVRKALMNPENYAAITNTLNHVGYLAEAFYPSFPAYPEEKRFLISLALTPGGLKNSDISQPKLRNFIRDHQQNHDFMLIEHNDFSTLTQIYQKDAFRVVAVLKPDPAGERTRLFALHTKHLISKAY